MSHLIHLRPASDGDRQFVDNLLYTTMHRYVEATWPKDQGAQRHYYEINKFDAANTRIIQAGGKDVGRLSTTIRSDCIFIDEIHISPGYQHQGLGRRAIEQVLREASEKHLPVKATILTVNHPSQRLFFGMGFEIVGEMDHRFHILRMPDALHPE
jgi:GNAT superfamily N-acetyltransferase